MSLLTWVDFQSHGDDRGQLVALEEGRNVPFAIKRVYYIFKTKPQVSRGFHAHRFLRQVAVCVSGRCRMVLDNGKTREETWLDNPARGLLIEGLVWREMHDFSDDCVLMVLADALYNEQDYIRDYQQFSAEALDA